MNFLCFSSSGLIPVRSLIQNGLNAAKDLKGRKLGDDIVANSNNSRQIFHVSDPPFSFVLSFLESHSFMGATFHCP